MKFAEFLDTKNLSEEQKEALKKSIKQSFKEGFVFQRFNHTCGYQGNAYYKVGSKWYQRLFCPQCNEAITWKTLEEVMRPMIPKAPIPKFTFNGEEVNAQSSV